MTRGRNDSGRNNPGGTGKWAKRPVTLFVPVFFCLFFVVVFFLEDRFGHFLPIVLLFRTQVIFFFHRVMKNISLVLCS